MRELDQLLTRYLEQRFEHAPADEKAAFAALLKLSDPELNGYFLGRESPPSEPLAGVVDHILRLPDA